MRIAPTVIRKVHHPDDEEQHEQLLSKPQSVDDTLDPFSILPVLSDSDEYDEEIENASDMFVQEPELTKAVDEALESVLMKMLFGDSLQPFAALQKKPLVANTTGNESFPQPADVKMLTEIRGSFDIPDEDVSAVNV